MFFVLCFFFYNFFNILVFYFNIFVDFLCVFYFCPKEGGVLKCGFYFHHYLQQKMAITHHEGNNIITTMAGPPKYKTKMKKYIYLNSFFDSTPSFFLGEYYEKIMWKFFWGGQQYAKSVDVGK